MLLGTMAVAGGFLICMAAGLVRVTAVHFPADLFPRLVVMIMVVIGEELMFRGYILRRFMAVHNKYMALLVSSLLFMLAHAFNSHLGVLPVINLFLAGVLLGSYYIYTQNLWFPIGLHFTWNFVQGPVLGYAVSGADLESIVVQQPLEGMDWLTGGAFGFEGSVLCTVACLLLTLAVHSRLRKKPFPC
jgi:membrane protease YdiL (CAAX protease family)